MAETINTGRRGSATKRSKPLSRRLRPNSARSDESVVVVREYRRPAGEPPRLFEPSDDFGVSEPVDVVEMLGRCEQDPASPQRSEAT